MVDLIPHAPRRMAGQGQNPDGKPIAVKILPAFQKQFRREICSGLGQAFPAHGKQGLPHQAPAVQGAGGGMPQQRKVRLSHSYRDMQRLPQQGGASGVVRVAVGEQNQLHPVFPAELFQPGEVLFPAGIHQHAAIGGQSLAAGHQPAVHIPAANPLHLVQRFRLVRKQAFPHGKPGSSGGSPVLHHGRGILLLIWLWFHGETSFRWVTGILQQFNWQTGCNTAYGKSPSFPAGTNGCPAR